MLGSSSPITLTLTFSFPQISASPGFSLFPSQTHFLSQLGPSLRLCAFYLRPQKVDGGYVFTPVCLCAGHLKKLWKDSDEIWLRGCVCDNNKFIRFLLKIQMLEFKKIDSSPLRDGAKNDT